MQSNLRIILSLILATGVTAPAIAVDLFVSNPAEGAIYSLDSGGGAEQTPALLFSERRFEIGDLVMGPDDLLYVCAPDEGMVFRFDPIAAEAAGGYSLDDVEVLDTTGIVAPQCGWFSDKGDLFLTDRLSETAVWIYKDLVPLSLAAPAAELATLVPAAGLFAGFAGKGVTQAAPGDLLFVDQANDQVGLLEFDPIFRFEAPTSMGPYAAYTGLTNPVGVARSSGGAVFVASGAQVVSFESGACSAFSFNGQTPQFLQFVSDDILYVASTSKKAATVWSVDVGSCGAPQPIFTFERPDYVPSLSGVAVPRTARTEGSTTTTKSDADFVFNFRDHAYELSFTPEGSCTPNPITATGLRPACLARLLSPPAAGGYLYDDQNELGTDATGTPVPYAGDGGVAQVYTLGGDCPGVEEIQHAVSAYTALIGNPRLVRCEFPEGIDLCADELPPYCGPDDSGCVLAYCELTELESFFPFNGIFPDDARTGTRTQEFSEYFIADIDLADGTVNVPGCFCGWQDPLPNVATLDPIDPFLGLPLYNSGSSVPLKFKVAALATGETCETTDPCDGSPNGYVENAKVLLSVAKVFDAAGSPDFRPLVPTSTSSSVDGTIFGSPTSPATPYHYNLDTTGYEPGVYQAVAVALTDNFEVEWTYFAIR